MRETQPPKPSPPPKRGKSPSRPTKKAVKRIEPLVDIEFGLDWGAAGLAGLPELHKRIYCARNRAGNVSLFEHRKRIIQMLWPDYAWHPWTERRLKGWCENNYTGWYGPGGCMDGSTVLENPITGERPTMQELYDSGERPVVMTLLGPIKAESLHLKGFESLYTITLESGRSFTANAEHRVLTKNGYARVDALSIADVLHGVSQAAPELLSASLRESFPVHPGSILDTCQSVHVSNVLSSQKITASS